VRRKKMDAIRIKNLANAYALAVATTELGQPSGHLYALVAQPMGACLDEHLLAVQVLCEGGLIEEHHHLLLWAGSEDLQAELIKNLGSV